MSLSIPRSQASPRMGRSRLSSALRYGGQRRRTGRANSSPSALEEDHCSGWRGNQQVAEGAPLKSRAGAHLAGASPDRGEFRRDLQRPMRRRFSCRLACGCDGSCPVDDEAQSVRRQACRTPRPYSVNCVERVLELFPEPPRSCILVLPSCAARPRDPKIGMPSSPFR